MLIENARYKSFETRTSKATLVRSVREDKKETIMTSTVDAFPDNAVARPDLGYD